MMLLYVCGRRCRSPPSLLRGVQGASVDGLFDSTGHLVALPRLVLRAEVVVSGACMLAYGRGVLVGEGQSDFVVVLLQLDVSATIRPPKPPPPSAPGSPTPTFNINDTRPKGQPPGSRNRNLSLVDITITMAATPTTAPQATLLPPAATRRPGRPRKDTATAAAGAPLAATASATPLPAPPTHMMTTRARTLRASAVAAPSSAPGTQAS
jgi:hypothetical protein